MKYFSEVIRVAPLLALASSLAVAQDLQQLATASIRKNCLGCHGEKTKMGGLVLETRETALKGGATGPAIDPSKPAASLLLQKVRDGKMPPGNPLPSSERELFAKWLEAGAPWTAKLTAIETKRAGKDWWSLQPLKVQPPPSASDWARTPIDRYLLAAMSAKGLKPSREADRRTLIRRLTFDLTGLPPTPAETAAFESDASPHAYERLVDRLLSGAAYGERWGRHWMDVIRFGESHGYEQNHLRPNAWHFRDYIIRSFNEDKPFDRLVLEHLAGDRVAQGDPAIAAGTGFLVAGPHDTVGNQAEAFARQQRADDLDDMVNATASSFLGLTVNCAKCHDHKFDPILQTDYYSMAAVFAGVVHSDGEFATPEARRRYHERADPIEAELREVSEKLKQIRADATPRMKERRDAILAKYRPAVDARLTEESFAPVATRYVRLHIEATTSGGAAGLDELEVWSGDRNVALHAKVHASSVRKADDDAEAYSEKHLTDGKFDRRWFPETNRPVDLTIELPEEVNVQRVSWSRDREGGFMGRFEGPIPSNYRIEISRDGKQWTAVASSEGRMPALETQRDELVLLAVLDDAQRTAFRTHQQRQQELRKQLNAIEKLPAAYIGKFEEPKTPVYVLNRGNVMDRGPIAPPASPTTLDHIFPRFVLNNDAPEWERRLALAKWITDRRNPLTPRVLANRLWHYHFGRGIVGTPSDFGFNGERPSHPELLDYLASQLHAYNWRLKPLHKEIVMSMAYRQSSAMDEANAAIDSEARYLWRFPPQRLTAEAIRDSVLAASGKLNRTMGGPGFHLYRYTVDNVATYYPLEQFGENTYRRSVYQMAARSVRSEMLGQYDCPDSALPEPRRIVTTSPLQALALLNNSFMVDQSRFFAERLKREAGADPTQQIARGFALAFNRAPNAVEIDAARDLIAKHGLQALCRAILNSNEFLYVQ